MLTENDLDFLREDIKRFVGDGRRYNHILAVEKESRIISARYDISNEIKLKIACAALLHDITKQFTIDYQKELFKKYNIPFGIRESKSIKTLHAVTGAEFAFDVYSKYVDTDIKDAIRWHTTAHDNMTMMEKIIYLSDYIEETRTFDDCITLRKTFYKLTDNDNSEETLNKIMFLSLQMTINQLLMDGMYIHDDTINAYNYFYIVCNKD